MTTSLIALSLLTLGQTAPAQAPAEGFAATWRKVESAITSRYYGRQSKKELMTRLLAETAPKAAAAKSRAEFSQIVNGMIQQFGDSHFDFFTPSDQGFYLFDSLAKRDNAQEMPQIGAWFSPAPAGGYTVKMVLNGQEADKAGLRQGDVILTLNGQPFTPVDSLAANLEKPVTLTYSRNGQSLTATVTPRKTRALTLFMTATRASAKVFDYQGLKVGYVRVWTMADRMFHEFLKTWTLNGPGAGTDAFILDLRDGFGGRPEGFYEPFFAPQYNLDWKIGSVSTRQITGYGKPMALLTNPGTRSAKEVVSAIFKNSGRATLIGGPTAGDVLGTTPFAVEPWAYLEIPMVELTIDGKTLEKNPVPADIRVSPEIGGDGSDLVIMEALKTLRGKVKS